MYHTFFIHSSVDGHLGCFLVLAIVNSAAMTIGCMYLFKLEFLSFLDICSVVGLLNHMVTLFYVFIGTSILFSIVAVPIYILSNSVGEVPFLRMELFSRGVNLRYRLRYQEKLWRSQLEIESLC